MPICRWFWVVSGSGARPGSVFQPIGPVGQIAFQWCLRATAVSLWQPWHSWRPTQTPHFGEQWQLARGHQSAQWVLTHHLGKLFAKGCDPRALEPDETEPGIARGGWQHEAASRVELQFRQEVLFERMGSTDRATLRSQGGSGAGLALTVSPTTLMTKIPPHLFRTILFRRLRLPLPFSRYMCRCGRPIDSFRHHRASCTRTGALGRRGFALESAAVRVCREAGARVTTNCSGPGSGFASPSCRRQSQIGSGRGWVAHFRWVPVGLGHDSGMCFALRWSAAHRSSRHAVVLQRARRRKELQVPRARGQRKSGAPRCFGHRGWREVVT